MTKLKIAAAALAALSVAGIGGARAQPHLGYSYSTGFAAGALIAVAATNGPSPMTPSGTECRSEQRYDRWGNLRMLKICNVPY